MTDTERINLIYSLQDHQELMSELKLLEFKCRDFEKSKILFKMQSIVELLYNDPFKYEEELQDELYSCWLKILDLDHKSIVTIKNKIDGLLVRCKEIIKLSNTESPKVREIKQ